MTDSILLLTFLSIVGALFSAVLGWLDSGEPFAPKKFTASILRAVIAGIVSALGFSTLETVAYWDYALAFLAGAGIDVFGNRISGAIASRNKEATSAPT
jgi:hypothetical protein